MQTANRFWRMLHTRLSTRLLFFDASFIDWDLFIRAAVVFRTGCVCCVGLKSIRRHMVELYFTIQNVKIISYKNAFTRFVVFHRSRICTARWVFTPQKSGDFPSLCVCLVCSIALFCFGFKFAFPCWPNTLFLLRGSKLAADQRGRTPPHGNLLATIHAVHVKSSKNPCTPASVCVC